jgi:hypothetical protein
VGGTIAMAAISDAILSASEMNTNRISIFQICDDILKVVGSGSDLRIAFPVMCVQIFIQVNTIESADFKTVAVNGHQRFMINAAIVN